MKFLSESLFTINFGFPLPREIVFACSRLSWNFIKILHCEFMMGTTKICLLIPTFQALYAIGLMSFARLTVG